MGFLNLFKTNKDPSFISDKEKEEFMKNNPRGKDLIELKNYTEKAIKKESKLIGSKRSYPLCPVCGEEFKDKESLFSHLRNNKREFMTLPKRFDYSFDYVKPLGNVGGYATSMTFGNVHLQFDVKGHLRERGIFMNPTINSKQASFLDYNLEKIKYLIDLELLKHRIFLELEEQKYKEWKGETKIKTTRENPLSPKLRFEILKRDKYTCQYCGRKSPEVELEVDHIEPYSKTKDNSPGNLITSCKDCNRGKRIKEVI